MTAAPLSPPTSSSAKGFTLLPPSETGVEFANRLDPNHRLKRLYHSGFVCGGAAIGDVDGDGRPDLFFASGPGENRLYRQTGAFRFEDVTSRAGVGGGEAWGAGAALVDIDNDGDLDIYVCNYDSPNQLFLNGGGCQFREAASEFGLDLVDACLTPAFCDYDRDGDLDAYVLTNRLYLAGGRPRRPPYSVRDGRPYVLPEFEQYYVLKRQGAAKYTIDNTGRRDHLLRNNGDGTFSNVTTDAGISAPGHGLSVTWWDYDLDGWPDAYIGNDFNDPDHLYRNNGDGSFTDVITDVIPHTSWFSMGADFGDLNDDGRFDLLVADMSARSHYGRMTTMLAMNAGKIARIAARPPQVMKNALYVNTGAGRFFEAAELAGLADSDWSWAIKLADFDSDGRNDVFISNGTVRGFTDADHPMDARQMIGRTEWDHYADEPPCPQQNLAFRNAGDLVFDDVSHEWGLDKVAMSYAAAYADLDRDGDLDLVVVNLDEPVSVYRNDLTTGSHLLIALRGTISNRYGVGATVSIETAAGRQIRMLSPQTGFLSGNEPVVHFGLGDAQSVGRIVVDWPSGRRQEVRQVEANQLLTLVEPSGDAPDAAMPRSAAGDNDQAPWLRPTSTVDALQHVETAHNDFATQPLLPRKLSQLGPGIAVTDYDQDGDEDFYLGGAAGQAGSLAVNQGDGQFRLESVPAFEAHKSCEDMGAVWFDADGDGDVDLYVVSGGVEAKPGAESYRDRLYLNDGHGALAAAEEGVLPDLRDSGSAVAAADFDRDGDLDLVVGARVIPGQYPLAPASRLLENEGGRFVDATRRLAPDLLTAGMVTSALWSDADGDGWLDLLLTTEWGPVRLLRNQRGRLAEETIAAGLADRHGWWNGIAARDLDGDLDIDYVVTNFGLNTRYKASAEEPAVLYYGDFDGSGAHHLVEAEHQGGTLIPIRNRDCSSRAMPHLAMMFATHHEFGVATLEDLYTPEAIRAAKKFTATALASGVLLNDGSGKFTFNPLPRIAQAAPAFGLVLTEINGDASADLCLVQNFLGAAPELGRMDGGMGLLLTGNGDATFTPVEPGSSGLVVPTAATSLVQCLVDQEDDRPALLVGVNDGPMRAFEPSSGGGPAQDSAPPRFVKVALAGPAGNPQGYGARVTLLLGNGASQTAEVAAGGGYLSQSTPCLVFGIPTESTVRQIDVLWPDGAHSTHPFRGSIPQMLSHPGQN